MTRRSNGPRDTSRAAGQLALSGQPSSPRAAAETTATTSPVAFAVDVPLAKGLLHIEDLARLLREDHAAILRTNWRAKLPACRVGLADVLTTAEALRVWIDAPVTIAIQRVLDPHPRRSAMSSTTDSVPSYEPNRLLEIAA